MRDYAKISPKFWIHGSGRRLRGDAEAQLVALHLLTGPSSTMIGLYYLPLSVLAHELGQQPDRVSATLDRVSDAGFASYDHETELVWVHNAAEFEFGDGKQIGPKRAAGIVKQLKPFGNHHFVREFMERYGVRYKIANDDPRDAKSGYPIDTVSTFGHQDQDQDQDQKQGEQKGIARTPERLTPVGSNHPEVAFFEARYAELFPGALAFDAKTAARAAEVIRRCAENKRRWQDVLEGFADPRWAFALGSLDWLRDHLGEVVQWIAKGKPAKKPAAPFAQLGNGDTQKREVRPTSEQTRDRLAAEDRLRKQADPEKAKDAVSAILAKLK